MRRAVGVAVATTIALLGCGPKPAPVTASPFVKWLDSPRLRPYVIDWKADERVRLEKQIDQGGAVVAVTEEGPTVLSRCRLESGYTYNSVTPRDEHLMMNNRASLAANLPIAALTVGAEFETGTAVELDWMMVGMVTFNAPDAALELVGDCEGATHYVAEVVLGAFEVRSSNSIGGAAKVGAVKLSNGQSIDLSRRDGNMEACKQARADQETPPSECATMVQVELLPLRGTKASKSARPTCQEGFEWNGSSCVERAQASRVGGYECDAENPAECAEQCAAGNANSCFHAGQSRLAAGASDAIEYLERACNDQRPVAAACAELGNLQAQRGEWRQAAQLRGKACNHGSADGCADFAAQALAALGVSRADASQAVLPARRACSLGSPSGCGTVARLELFGPDGVRRQASEVTAGLVAACEAGDRAACVDLVSIREYGLASYQKSAAEALKAYSAECQARGTPMGCVRGGLLIERGGSSQRAREAALEMYARGCDSEALDWCADEPSLRASLPASALDDEAVVRLACGSFTASALSCYNAALILESSFGAEGSEQKAKRFLDLACERHVSAACRSPRIGSSERM